MPRPAGPRLITLSSDLGAAYAAQMKAVLLRARPAAQVVDLAHDLRPHAIVEAAFVVRAMAERFPAGTVHVVVVDPGVGGRRRPIVVACRDGSVLVGPDNGVLAPLAGALGGGVAYRIERARIRAGSRVGTTFDGRDLFAPAAARLAGGTAPNRLGPRVPLTPSPEAPARRLATGATGTIVHVDRFGNLISNVPSAWVPNGTRELGVRLGRTGRRLPFTDSYEAAGPGRPLVLGSSFGTVEVAVAQGRADRRLGVRSGDRVRFLWRPAPRAPARRNRK